MERKLLRISEFGLAAGIAPQTVRRWAREGRITSVKLGRSRRIPATELDRVAQDGVGSVPQGGSTLE